MEVVILLSKNKTKRKNINFNKKGGKMENGMISWNKEDLLLLLIPETQHINPSRK